MRQKRTGLNQLNSTKFLRNALNFHSLWMVPCIACEAAATREARFILFTNLEMVLTRAGASTAARGRRVCWTWAPPRRWSRGWGPRVVTGRAWWTSGLTRPLTPDRDSPWHHRVTASASSRPTSDTIWWVTTWGYLCDMWHGDICHVTSVTMMITRITAHMPQ